MFILKESTEIIELEQEIKVVGLSLQKSGLPISFDSLGKLWERYGSTYRERNKVENSGAFVTEYAVALNTVLDYITGCEVDKIGEVTEESSSFVIPKGKYIKDTFNAESFELLVSEALLKRNVMEWAKKNKITIDGEFSVEVYPWAEFDKKNFEMYTLTPIKG